MVNRQLCVANAFEQLLEERTPRFHRALRKFYDTYGYPVSKYIRTPLTADIIYLLMKPLEWMFVLTGCEDAVAVIEKTAFNWHIPLPYSSALSLYHLNQKVYGQ